MQGVWRIEWKCPRFAPKLAGLHKKWGNFPGSLPRTQLANPDEGASQKKINWWSEKDKSSWNQKKRPLTPYLKFVSDNVHLKAENPGKEGKELMTMMEPSGKDWPQNPKNAK